MTDLLFVDLETTGLEPQYGKILEIGYVLTTPDLAVKDRASWVIPYPAEMVRSLRDNAPEVVRVMHDASGLWQACADADGKIPVAGAGPAVVALARDWPIQRAEGDVPLAGSSVHFDRAWLAEHTHFDKVLSGRTHRLADVSAMREFLERWVPHVVEARPPAVKRHRVDSDLDDTLSEVRHYRQAIVGAFQGVNESTDLIKSLVDRPSHRFDVFQRDDRPTAVLDKDGHVWNEDGGNWSSPTSPESPLATLDDIEVVAGPLTVQRRA